MTPIFGANATPCQPRGTVARPCQQAKKGLFSRVAWHGAKAVPLNYIQSNVPPRAKTPIYRHTGTDAGAETGSHWCRSTIGSA